MTIPVTVDTKAAEAGLKQLNELSQNFSQSITSAMEGAILGGKAFDQVLKDLALSLSKTVLSQALNPVQNALGSGLESVLGNLFSSIPSFAKGDAFNAGKIQPFADGGVVSAPSYFPMSGGLGLMGEAGPEAIMPLARGPDGRLGVRGGGAPINISVNIQTRDAESFRRSQGQVSSMLARAVGRGQREM
ncbi:MAG: phage tail tape measure protein [Rhizobiales bacterium]|nr:phage tail tape measure protein [Hyphomicrobiales bacterium]